jgi:hypothetical protein
MRWSTFSSLRQGDLVRFRIESEEKISFMNDVAVFEKYTCGRASDLGAYFDLRDGRKLTEEAQTRIKVSITGLLTTTRGSEAGPDAETALVIAELRALGGAWDREPAVPNAVATRGLQYSLLGVSAGPLSQEQQLKRSVAELLDGMKPWQGDRRYVNNLAPDEAADAAAIYGPERYERLASIKKTYDPANMFRLNHNVKPAGD